MAANSELVRLSVNMNVETAASLRELADRHGRSFTETIRRAIGIAKFLDDELALGHRIQVVDEDRKTTQELIFT